MIGVGGGAPEAVEELEAATHEGDGERAHWLAYSLVPGLGPVGFATLVRNHGSARAAWRAGESALAALQRLPSTAIPAWRRLAAMGAGRVARRLEARARAAGGRTLTPLDRDYPVALRALEPRPYVLHAAGDLTVFGARAVAVVGTRKPSGYGLSCATEIADELARAQVVTVSGLAIGIDGAAHRASLAAGGLTIAVLPSGLDGVYPPRHRALAREIVDRGGALVTEAPSGHVVGRPDFARRNRVIAGLAEATVVVEAPDRSGALLTAAAAAAIGREVYAVPGPIDAAASRGCNRLIADHQAAIVTSPAGLLRQIGVARGALPPSVASMSEVEAHVLYQLLRRSASIEELIDRLGLAAGAVASALTMLEARGLATAFGGVTFHPTLPARRLGVGTHG